MNRLEYEARRKRFKRSHPGQPYDPNWKEPKYKHCRSGKHLMTPKNTRFTGRDMDRRCNKCYKTYRRKYMKKWGLSWIKL